MSLPSPNLDDRRFADLLEEAKERIQQRCPAWTDFNPSDPGDYVGGIDGLDDRNDVIPP